MIKRFLSILLLLPSAAFTQTGNYISSGSETVNHGIISLSTNTDWSTARTSTPGYFSAATGGVYMDADDAHNINGYVKHYVTTNGVGFSYPVGSGTDLRILGTSGPALLIGDQYAAAWIPGDPSTTTDPTDGGTHSTASFEAILTAVSSVGQWDWQALSGTGAGVTITVSIPDMSLFATTANLRLVGWDGTQWLDLSGIATASGNTENSTLSGTMFAGITAIGIGSGTIALSLDMIAFNGNAHNCEAELVWRVTNEQDVVKYLVEKSTDGISYTQVSSVNATNQSGVHDYSVTTPQEEQDALYRITVVNSNGSITYTKTVRVQTNCHTNYYVRAQPNPMNGDAVTVSILENYSGPASILLTDIYGRVLSATPVSLRDGLLQETKIPVSNLSPGTYFIRVISNSGISFGSSLKIIRN